MTIRSKGNSKIIGAAAVPMTALARSWAMTPSPIGRAGTSVAIAGAWEGKAAFGEARYREQTQHYLQPA